MATTPTTTGATPVMRAMASKPLEGFPPIVVPVGPGLQSPGDTVSTQGKIEVDAVELGGRSFELSDGLSYDVALTNTGEGVLASGIVRGVACTPCDRCLETARIDIASEVSCYYLREEPQIDDDEDDQDFGLIDELTDSIDLSEAIRGAVLGDLPFVVLCREDCKGLCPTCGCNLNEETCDCAERRAAEVDPMSPFSALASFSFDEGDAGGR